MFNWAILLRRIWEKGKVPTQWIKCTYIAHQGYQTLTDFVIFCVKAESKAHTLGRDLIQRANDIIASQFGGK